MTRACQVLEPTMPSTVTDGMSWWRACWKPRTAASVLGPKIPSTCRPLLGSPDRLRNWNSSWTPRTASPWLPCLTVMMPGYIATDPNLHQGMQAAEIIVPMAQVGLDGPTGVCFDASGPLPW